MIPLYDSKMAMVWLNSRVSGWLFIFLAALGFSSPLSAALSLQMGVEYILTFDELPEQDVATTSSKIGSRLGPALPGDGGTFPGLNTPSSYFTDVYRTYGPDTLPRPLDPAQFNIQEGHIGLSPAFGFQWSAEHQALYSSPSGSCECAGLLLQIQIINASAQPASAIRISYDIMNYSVSQGGAYVPEDVYHYIVGDQGSQASMYAFFHAGSDGANGDYERQTLRAVERSGNWTTINAEIPLPLTSGAGSPFRPGEVGYLWLMDDTSRAQLAGFPDNTYLIDNIRFTLIPEPGTVGTTLLGLGWLSLMTRRLRRRWSD